MYEIIEKKRDGYELSAREIQYFIDGYLSGEIPDYQAASLLMDLSSGFKPTGNDRLDPHHDAFGRFDFPGNY